MSPIPALEFRRMPQIRLMLATYASSMMCAANRELDFPASDFRRIMQFFPFYRCTAWGSVGVYIHRMRIANVISKSSSKCWTG